MYSDIFYEKTKKQHQHWEQGTKQRQTKQKQNTIQQ